MNNLLSKRDAPQHRPLEPYSLFRSSKAATNSVAPDPRSFIPRDADCSDRDSHPMQSTAFTPVW